jgi:RES domain-containing protein
MTPLPPPLGTGELRFWRLDQKPHAATWDSGEGAFLVGGRWNSKGVRAVYASLDPATAILEVAVHKGFKALDTAPHILTSARIMDPAQVHVLDLEKDIPNPNWLVPGSHGPGQRSFGDALLHEHIFILIPSTVSRQSWNVIFDSTKAQGHFDTITQDPFALDPRLHV